MGEYRLSGFFGKLAKEVIAEHPDLDFIRICGVHIGFVISKKKKTSGGEDVLGECKRVTPPYEIFTPCDYLIVIYEDAVDGLTLDQLKVLLYHEMLHIDVERVEGELKCGIRQHDLHDFRDVTKQYGTDWAVRKENEAGMLSKEALQAADGSIDPATAILYGEGVEAAAEEEKPAAACENDGGGD